MAEDRNDETYLLYNVVRWITDPDSHEEIEEYFNQLENKPKDDTKNDSEEIKDTSEKDDVNVQDNLLKKENEKLKAEVLGKEERIKELELIQTSIADESKLGSTRAENNAAKLILALSELASIDISKPYAPYESLKTQGELLGVDKFPSDENVATWLKRANAQKS